MNYKRIFAGFLDLIICAFIQAIFCFIFIIYPLLQQNQQSNLMIKFILITFVSLLYLLIRDVLGKGSVGKKIFKLQIVDKNNGNKVSGTRRLLRNITWFLGLFEVLFILIKGYRIGDLIAQTNVMDIKADE